MDVNSFKKLPGIDTPKDSYSFITNSVSLSYRSKPSYAPPSKRSKSNWQSIKKFHKELNSAADHYGLHLDHKIREIETNSMAVHRDEMSQVEQRLRSIKFKNAKIRNLATSGYFSKILGDSLNWYKEEVKRFYIDITNQEHILFSLRKRLTSTEDETLSLKNTLTKLASVEKSTWNKDNQVKEVEQVNKKKLPKICQALKYMLESRMQRSRIPKIINIYYKAQKERDREIIENIKEQIIGFSKLNRRSDTFLLDRFIHCIEQATIHKLSNKLHRGSNAKGVDMEKLKLSSFTDTVKREIISRFFNLPEVYTRVIKIISSQEEYKKRKETSLGESTDYTSMRRLDTTENIEECGKSIKRYKYVMPLVKDKHRSKNKKFVRRKLTKSYIPSDIRSYV